MSQGGIFDKGIIMETYTAGSVMNNQIITSLRTVFVSTSDLFVYLSAHQYYRSLRGGPLRWIPS